MDLLLEGSLQLSKIPYLYDITVVFNYHSILARLLQVNAM